ncbi:MAG: hypothetical protein VYE40_13900 [Myxococcota bacterium]|nr:hypothetical protein [Myxococcota bacterium]
MRQSLARRFSATPTRARWILPLCALLMTGCGFDYTTDPRPPERVKVVFDPATSTIPLPNSAALDADGTLPKLSAERGTAQAAFYDWLDDLNGWLPETGIEIPFDGELDEESITTDAFKLVEIAEDGTLTELTIGDVLYSTVDEEGSPAKSVVTVVPAEPLVGGKKYGAIALKTIKGTNGETVGEPAAIFFGMNNGPLVVDGEVTIPQLADDPATAAQLEAAVRIPLAPLTAGLDQLGVERKEVAAALVWTTSVDTFTVLDPATATIPLPNTIAMDVEEDGSLTFPAAGLETLSAYRAAVAQAEEEGGPAPERNAQIYFEEYLDQLHGWPNEISSLVPEVPLSGPVDPDTLTEDTVQLWKVNADGTPERLEGVTIEYIEEEGKHKLRLTPQENFALATDYFAFVTRDVKDPNGNELLPPAAMLLAMQPEPLIDADGKSLLGELSDADAQAATGVQRVLAPTMAMIDEAAGEEYEDLATVFSWYTWKDPFIVFDPLGGDVPFPNAFLIGDDGTAELPISPGATPVERSLFDEVNSRDGFSTLGYGWVTVYGDLDPASVTYFEKGQSGDERGAIAMADVPGALPTVIPPEVMVVDYPEGYGKLMFRPQLPLKKNTLHAAIITNRLKGTNGLAAQPTPIFVMLASEYPLYSEEEGSLVAQLPESAAPTLEEARLQYERLFLSAQLVSSDRRDTITGAFAFTTDDTTEPLQQVRAQVMSKIDADGLPTLQRACDVDNARDCDADLLDNNDGSNDAYSGPYKTYEDITRDFSNIAQVQWAAQFDSVNFLAADGSLNSYDELDTTAVPLTVYVPKTVDGVCEPPFRVVIAQHGLGSSRLISGMGMAPTFAEPETCLATVALDTVLHGGRASDSDTLHPLEYNSDESGEGFLSVNFVASKNNFVQGVVDLIVLNQLIRSGALEGVVENTTTNGMDPMFDTTKVGILGTSLGGIFSTDLLAIDPEINVGVLAVPPGKLTYYLTEESGIGDMVLAPLSLFDIEKGTFRFDSLMAIVQWVADVIDPANFAAHAVEGNTLEVLEYDPAMDAFEGSGDEVDPAQALVIMALDDDVAPNVSTRQLATILGLDLSISTYEGRHGFMNTQDTTDDNYNPALCARRQAAFFLRASLDGDDATIPSALEADTCVSNLN